MTWIHPDSSSGASDDHGGAFDYEAYPELFLDRRGVGPLWMVWDSNIVIDFVDHGSELINGGAPQGITEPVYLAELVALGGLVDLWMCRDIRLVVTDAQLLDKSHTRQREIDEAAAAILCLGLEYPRSTEPPAGLLADCLDRCPSGVDRAIVREAACRGMHIVVTRDKRLRRSSERVERLGLAIRHPSEVVEAIVARSHGHPLFGDDGLVADNHKWLHLLSLVESD